MKSTLHIPVIAGKTHLGCSEKERARAQSVQVGLRIKFGKLPPACETDTLDSTPCYKEMSELLAQVFKKKEYATIEHLCLHCTQGIEKYLKKFTWLKEAKLSVTLTKVAPPVDAIEQGSIFTIEKRI